MVNFLKQNVGSVIIILLAAAISLTGCHGDSGKEPEVNRTSGDAQFFVNAMLDIKDPQFLSTDSEGVESIDELKVQEKWGDLYNKYKNSADAGDETGYKYFLFIGFLAYSQHNAELMEAYSSDLMPIYEKDAGKFLETLNELPFLIQSSGYYLDNYFGFEDKNAEKKPEFLKNNKPLINDILGPENGILFLDSFD